MVKAIINYLLESLDSNTYYRITTNNNPTKPNRVYDKLEDEDVPKDEIFGTTKQSLDAWIELFIKETPNIEKLYVWEFQLPNTPSTIEDFTYKGQDYTEFTFNPDGINFELYKTIDV